MTHHVYELTLRPPFDAVPSVKFVTDSVKNFQVESLRRLSQNPDAHFDVKYLGTENEPTTLPSVNDIFKNGIQIGTFDMTDEQEQEIKTIWEADGMKAACAALVEIATRPK
jgi:hypothetical protein